MVFDPALSMSKFQEALDCGVLALSEIPALGSTTISITPYAVNDTLNALKLNNQTCWDLYNNENNDQTYLYYESRLASTGDLNSSSCDISIPGYEPGHDCISQVIIRFGTTYLTTYWSKRKKESTDVLVDIGGIVGGVCFVFWFWGLYTVRP